MVQDDMIDLLQEFWLKRMMIDIREKKYKIIYRTENRFLQNELDLKFTIVWDKCVWNALLPMDFLSVVLQEYKCSVHIYVNIMSAPV